MTTGNLTPERLREVLHYDPETGIFIWRSNRGGTARINSVAGTIHAGHIRIMLYDKFYYAHRLAWLYMTGKWPANQIDHRDTNKNNNIFSNLREANRSINSQNQRRAHRSNKLGILGIYKSKNRFKAELRVNGQGIYLGSFSTKELAHAAYIEAKRRHHPGCTL